MKLWFITALCLCLTATSAFADTPNESRHYYPLNDHNKKLVFYSNIEVNLHHFLYELARDENQLQQLQNNPALTNKQKARFSHAAQFYKTRYIDKKEHLVWSDAELGRFTALLNNRATPENNNSELQQIFHDLLPLYQQSLWPQHFKQNQHWQRQLATKLDKYGQQIQTALEQAFQSPLVVIAQHPVDIVYKAGIRQGAYTTGRVPHTTINSTDADYAGWAALEMLFHELSHAVAVNRNSKLSQLIKAEFTDSKVRVWHPILFYTVAQVVKQAIAAEHPNYVSYAGKQDLYMQGWGVDEAVLIKYWQPYLEGKVTMAQAIKNLARHYP
ncbi:hypothetical protein SG34_026335 [Thalassomonas viridans]|uniref:DUF2268 domain-containing protein n=1 Tax=Thalassomonas viridans TaxID=137584 RepID=A0AAE9Z2E3_9GAMM|nr:hypothetical protein [Thalassomonas viridans]WDE04790.1 hypothetical protein SG34_026335 [Thalassomonas viridans]